MKRMSKEMKLFGIAFLSILILIFGALIGILISLNSVSNNYFDEDALVISPEELEEIGIDFYSYDAQEFERVVHFESYIFSLEEFSRQFQRDIESPEELVEFLENNDFFVEFEEEEIFAEREVRCEFEEIYNENICFEERVEYFFEEDELVIERIKFVEFEEEDFEDDE